MGEDSNVTSNADMSTSVEENKKLISDALSIERASYLANQQTANDKSSSAQITYDTSVTNEADGWEGVTNLMSSLNIMMEVNADTTKADATGTNALAIATIASTDAKTISTNLEAAAKLVDAAADSVSKLNSDVASITAKLVTSDDNTTLEKSSKTALESSGKAAKQSEITISKLLDVSIRAAKYNAVAVQDAVKVASTDTAALLKAINTNTTNLQAAMATTYTNYIGVVNTMYTNDKALETSTADANTSDKLATLINEDDEIVIPIEGEADKRVEKKGKKRRG